MTIGLRRATGAVLVVLGAACSSRVDVDKVPVGTEVQVTRQDGGVVSGKLAGKDAHDVTVDSGKGARSVARTDIADIQVVKPGAAPSLPPIAKFREYTIPAGTRLTVRLENSVSSESSHVEDPVNATLVEAVAIGGTEVLPEGSAVHGDVAAVQPSGKVKGRASMELRFRSVTARGRDYAISADVDRVAPATKTEDAKKIGIPAAAGAVIGAIVGGGKGAVVGTAIGGGAGTAVVMSTPGQPVTLDRGQVLTLVLGKSVDVRVPVG
jgi:hypothetical protein